MQIERKHLAGLELALSIADTVCTDSINVGQLDALIEQAKAAPDQTERDAALTLLSRVSSSYSALLSDCGLKHTELLSEVDALLKAQP